MYNSLDKTEFVLQVIFPKISAILWTLSHSPTRIQFLSSVKCFLTCLEYLLESKLQ